MSELAAPVVFYPQVLKNVRVKSKEECMNDPDVLAADEAAKKALGDKGRTLLRESGTEPVVRVMAEAPSEDLSPLPQPASKPSISTAASRSVRILLFIFPFSFRM
jgi:phosphomannomutase